MTRDEKIRVEYTHLLQQMQACTAVFSMVDMAQSALWDEIKTGIVTTEKTNEIKRWVQELNMRSLNMEHIITAIEEEIKRGAISEKQVRMEFKE